MSINREYYLTYERVSTEDQKMLSPNDQKAVNDRYIIGNGWKLAKNADYRDEGISGTVLERPGLQDLLIRCKEDPTIKGVVITETNRLARGNKAYIPIREALKKSGVDIIAVTQLMVNDTPEGNLIGEILSAVNGMQVDITRRKSMRALDEKAKRGWWPGKAPLGYLNVNIGTEDRPERIIAIDEQRAPYIKQIPKLYNDGFSYQEITDWLFDHGLRGNENGKISKEEVRKIIFSDFYLGEFIWRGVRYKGKHPPLFSWYQVQKARNRSQEKGHAHSGNELKKEFPFKRLPFRCVECNCHITAEKKIKHYKNRDAEYVLYHCTKSKGRKVCKQPSVNVKDLIQEFAEKVVRPIEIDEEIAEFMLEEMDNEAAFRETEQKKFLENITRRLGQIDTELQNLFEMRISNKIPLMGNKTPEDTFEEMRLKKEFERNRLLEAKSKLENDNDKWKEKASNFLSYCINATNLFLEAEEQKQYLFLRKISSNLFLGNKKVVVTYQFPFSELAKRSDRLSLLRG